MSVVLDSSSLLIPLTGGSVTIEVAEADGRHCRTSKRDERMVEQAAPFWTDSNVPPLSAEHMDRITKAGESAPYRHWGTNWPYFVCAPSRISGTRNQCCEVVYDADCLRCKVREGTSPALSGLPIEGSSTILWRTSRLSSRRRNDIGGRPTRRFQRNIFPFCLPVKSSLDRGPLNRPVYHAIPLPRLTSLDTDLIASSPALIGDRHLTIDPSCTLIGIALD